MEVDDAIRELKLLSQQKPLKGTSLDKFKELCVFLKREGFDNQSLAKLTGYGLPTIKEYTRGIKVSKTPTIDVISDLLSQMTDIGITLQNVQRYLLFEKELTQKGTDMKAISDFMLDLFEAKMDAKDAVALDSQLKSMKKAGISAEQIPALLQQMSQLVQMGFSHASTKTIVDAAKKYGAPDKVIQAINGYGGIADIEKKLSEADAALAAANKQMESAKAEVASLKTQRDGVQKDLDHYESLRAMGYDDSMLENLTVVSSKLGGAKKVFDALNKQSYLASLEESVKQIEQKKSGLETSLKELQASHVHLQPVIKLCDDLLYKYGFTVDTIEKVYELASKYGNSYEVLRALGNYEDIQALMSRISGLQQQEAGLQERLSVLRKEAAEAKDRMETLNKNVAAMMQTLSSNLAESYETGINQITETYQSVVEKTKQDAEEYAKRMAEARVFEDELKMARVMTTIFKYPTDVADLPLDFAVNIVDAAMRFLDAKKLNPKTPPPPELKEITYVPIPEIPVISLLYWSKRTLESAKLQG